MKKKWLNNTLRYILLITYLVVPFLSVSAQTSDLPGFRVQGRHLYDRFDNKVVLVGVNKMVIWTDRDGLPSFTEIAKTGANTVRIVWLTEGTAEELDIAISNAFNNKLIPMVDCHDSTGKWELLSTCVDYWVRPDILDVLRKHEQYLLINIANEAGEGVVSQWTFRTAYELAIKRMRHAGIHVPLVIDAQGYGQNIDDLQRNGPYLIQADPDHNLMFSIHMWWPTAWRGAGVKQYIIDEIAQSVEMELPLIVGEFANKGPGCACCIPYETIIEQCALHEIGYLPWSWGPGNGDCEEMDMTVDGTFDTLHGWGLEVAVTSTHSIKEIAVRPDWIIQATPIPLLKAVATPTPMPAPEGLISQGKTVRVSSSENDTLTGEAAVDGNLNTRWSSAWSDPQEITIDLGGILDFGRIVLEWETAFAKEYKLQVSEDGETWTELIHETNGNGGQDNIVVSASGRYVRLAGIQRATEWGYSLYEFWVFNNSKVPLPEVSDTQEVVDKPDLRPDLIITDITWASTTITPSSEIILRANVKNQGQAAALGRFSVLFTTGDTIIGRGTSERPLAPGEILNIPAQQTWQPEEIGTFVILANIDVDDGTSSGIIDEQNESNNMFAVYVSVDKDSAPTPDVTSKSNETMMPSPTPEAVTLIPEPTIVEFQVKTHRMTGWIWGIPVILGLVIIILMGLYLKKKR